MLISKEQGFLQIPILLSVLAISLLVSSQINITNEITKNDSNVKGVLLAKGGDDDGGGSGDSSSGSSNSGSGSSGNSGSGSSGSSGTEDKDDSTSTSNSGSSSVNDTTADTVQTNKSAGSGSQEPIKQNVTTKTGIRIKTEESPDRQRTEVKFSETEKIKTRLEADRTRIDVYKGGIKVRYEIKDGRVTIKAETEGGEDVPEQELFKIEERMDKTGIKVATAGGQIFVQKNNVGALANFPLQIDLNTNQLIASTSAGAKVLTVLPDQAIQNMLAANVINKLAEFEAAGQARLGNIGSVSDIVALGERNGVPVYEIQGLKKQKLLGLIPVTTSKKVFVSAETGEQIAQEQSLLANIVDFLSP